MLRCFKKIILFSIVGCFIISAPAFSQRRNGQMQANNVDQQIAIANYLLLDTNDKQALKWLTTAKEIKVRADRAVLAKDSKADDLYAQVSEYAVKSINRLFALRMQSLQDDLQTFEKFTGSNNQNLSKKAHKQLEQAKELLSSGNYRRAVAHLRMAGFQIERMQRLQAIQSNAGEYIEKEAERYAGLKKNVSAILQDCPESDALRLLRQVNNLEAKLHKALEEGDKSLVKNYYFQASRLLLRAMDTCRGYASSDLENAFEQVEFAGEMLTLFQNRLGRRTQQEKQVLVEASNVYELARVALSTEDYAAAEQNAQKVVEILSSDRSKAQPQNRNRRIQQEFRKLQQQINMAKNRATDRRANAFIQQAEFCLHEAESSLHDESDRMALAFIIAGQTFLQSKDKSDLVVRLGQLRQRLQAAERIQQTPRWKNAGPEIQAFHVTCYQQAREALQNSQFAIAEIYLNFIRNNTVSNNKRRRGDSK